MYSVLWAFDAISSEPLSRNLTIMPSPIRSLLDAITVPPRLGVPSSPAAYASNVWAVLLVDPIKCIYFLLFILLLQQFDGNILGPKILGDSTGLQSFWVLFSILLFGGLFGFVGMIIGVPTFAVFYRMVKEGVESSLKKKDLSSYTDDYRGLNYIDEEKKTFMKD